MCFEELDCLVDSHFQHIIDIHTVIFHIQHILFETLSMAAFAFQRDIRHKLHFHRDTAVPFTFFTASAFLIKREIGRRISQLFRQWLFTEQFTDLVVSTDISHRIRTRTLTDRVLIDKLDTLYHLHITFQAGTIHHQPGRIIQIMLYPFIKDIPHQRTLSRTADTGNNRHHVQRKFHIYPFQVILTGPFHLYIIIPQAPESGDFNLIFTGQITDRITVAAGLQVIHIPLVDHFAPQTSSLRTYIYNIIG